MDVCCPLCQKPIPVNEGSTLGPVLCTACGLTVTLAQDETRVGAQHVGPRALRQFELLEEVGSGGGGIVYKAHDSKLNRTVAVKVPRAGDLIGPRERDRFLREARSVARLRHCGIVPVHEFGEENGLPYLVSDFVNGLTLSDVLTARRLTPEEAAALVAAVADALQYSHEQGVIHRDVKASNIMIGTDGQARLIDFGLARHDAGEVTMTFDGRVLGTPAYMSPEQARGDGHDVDGRTDIYSLGVVLYLLLTGRLPFPGNLRMVLHQVLEDEPEAPRHIDRKAPKDLETITLKAMAKQPGERYSSAAELAADLRRYLDDEPILGRPVTLVRRVSKWARRRPSQAALVAVVVMAAAALVAGGAWSHERLLDRQARALVQTLETAEVTRVPALIRQIDRDRRRLSPLLVERAGALPADSPGRLHLALALLPEDPRQVEEIEPWLLREGPAPLAVIRAALQASGQARTARLWDVLEDPRTLKDRRFRAACALAALDPASPKWDRYRADVAAWLIAVDRTTLPAWADLFRPLRDQLQGPLRDHWSQAERGDESEAAALVLADYCDQPDLVLALFQEADPARLGPFVARLPSFGPAIAARFESELARTPEAPGPDREPLVKRRANLSIALLALGRPERVWPLLHHGSDDGLRTTLIHRIGGAGITPGVLIRRLDDEPDVSVRRALLLALGEYSESALPPSRRAELVPRLEALFQDDPDSGLHSAAEWLLRRWGRAADLQRIAQALGSKPSPRDREWSITPEGYTLAIVRGPVEFLMGPSPAEDDSEPVAPARRKRIERGFAIATKETTVEQYRRFQPVAARKGESMNRPGHPVQMVSFLDGVRYCRWLSRQEGMTDEQMSYPDPDDVRRNKGKPYPVDLGRPGYRLPTEAEWEHACRSGALTTRPYGSTDEFLTAYAWCFPRANGTAQPGGLLKPNDLGLFDMLGNLSEWCHDAYTPEPEGRERAAELVDNPTATGLLRVMRGGAFFYASSHVLPTARSSNHYQVPVLFAGLRVVKTLPDAPADSIREK